MVAAVYLGNQLRPKFGTWNATLAAGGAYIVAMAIVFLVMPNIDETPGPIADDAGVIVLGGYPARDLYEFRLGTLGTQVIIWTTIGLVSAALLSATANVQSRASRRPKGQERRDPRESE